MLQDNNECELNNLAVISEYRHKGIGRHLLNHTFEMAKSMNCDVINIGIVEENSVLKRWYEGFGYEHVGTQKFDFFPFTCGYMKKKI